MRDNRPRAMSCIRDNRPFHNNYLSSIHDNRPVRVKQSTVVQGLIEVSAINMNYCLRLCTHTYVLLLLYHTSRLYQEVR